MKYDKWAERYLNLARSVSTWSKDPSTKIGAVAVGSHGQIISQGYNGFPRGIHDTSERLEVKEEKYKYVVHGEMNCIYNSCLNGLSLKDTTLYVSGLPVCSECAKGIIQVGISTVITQYDKEKVNPNWAQSNLLTKQMFNEANVNYFEFDMNGELIV
jgi:dCMP deaminase